MIVEWLFDKAYRELKNCYIEKYLNILNKESEEEDIDKLFNELSVQMYIEKSNIAK